MTTQQPPGNDVHDLARRLEAADGCVHRITSLVRDEAENRETAPLLLALVRARTLAMFPTAITITFSLPRHYSKGDASLTVVEEVHGPDQALLYEDGTHLDVKDDAAVRGIETLLGRYASINGPKDWEIVDKMTDEQLAVARRRLTLQSEAIKETRPHDHPTTRAANLGRHVFWTAVKEVLPRVELPAPPITTDAGLLFDLVAHTVVHRWWMYLAIDRPTAHYEVKVFHNLASGGGDHYFEPTDQLVEVARLYIPAGSGWEAVNHVAGLLSPGVDRTGEDGTGAYWMVNRPVDFGDCLQSAGRTWTIGELCLERVRDFALVVQDAPGTVALRTPPPAPEGASDAVPADTIPDPDPWAADPRADDPWADGSF